jgi:hypothetical protein
MWQIKSPFNQTDLLSDVSLLDVINNAAFELDVFCYFG